MSLLKADDKRFKPFSSPWTSKCFAYGAGTSEKMEMKYIVISSDFKNKIHDVKKLKKFRQSIGNALVKVWLEKQWTSGIDRLR